MPKPVPPTPTVSKYMTPAPQFIGPERTLADARAMMEEQDIRHLPVVKDERLLGLLTDRDVHLIESLRDVEASQVVVADAMGTSVYSVGPDAALDDVVAEMAEHKYGSTIVMEHGKVVGIFTTVDVCRALAELLQVHLK